jgi:hypothetical protein
LPYSDGTGARIGHRVVGAFDHRQQSHFHWHVALVDFLDDEIEVQAASLDHALEIVGMVQEPRFVARDQRTFDFRQGEPVANAFPQTFRRRR